MRLHARDEAAFTELHEAYRPHLIAYLSHWADRDTAEDIAQEIFMIAWRVLPNYRFDVPLYFFLKRTAHLGALNRWRNLKGRRGDISLDDEDEGTAMYCATLPDPSVEEFDALLMKAQARDHLSAEHRAVISLLYGQGLTRSAAAQQMRCSVGTIETRHENALRQLRGYFLGEPIDLLPVQGAAIAKRAALREHYAEIDRSRLKGRYRTAFDLVYGRGLDYDDAARELLSTPSMARMWANGAVARLRRRGEIA